MKQGRFFRQQKHAFGGDLYTRRNGRGSRPLDSKHTMHLVLRSTQATGAKSFSRHRVFIDKLLERLATKNGVTIHRFANVGNHLHIHLKLESRHTWRAFIRALTAGIAIRIGKKSRWAPKTKRFWDRRPFVRIVFGRRGYDTLNNYVQINVFESFGVCRGQARAWIESS